MAVCSIIPTLGCAAGLLLLAALPAAAQTPDSTRAAAAQPSGSGTLIKLGTGLTRGYQLGGYSGLSVPLVLGIEHHLTPSVSVFANGFAGVRLSGRRRYIDGSRESIINDYGLDAGIRHYYNQEKRRREGRATGPFVGNYVALQTTSAFNHSAYQYSTLTAVWGMQRRIGKYGWFDAYVGAGIGRELQSFYDAGVPGRIRSNGRYYFAPEIGIKFSLGSRLTSGR